MSTKKSNLKKFNKTKKTLYLSLSLLTLSTLIFAPIFLSSDSNSEKNNSSNDYSMSSNSSTSSGISTKLTNDDSKINFSDGPIWTTTSDDFQFVFVDKNNDQQYDEIWGWGSNNNGTMGNGTITQQSTPIRLDTIWTFENNKNIINFIASDQVVFAFVDTNGDKVYNEIWGWGNNSYGQQGIGIADNNNIKTPQRLDTIWTFENGKNIVYFDIASLSIFAFVDATEDGIYDEIWGWGYNNGGTLGNGQLSDPVSTPIRLDTIWTFEDNKRIIDFYSEYYASFAFVDSDNDGAYDEIWGWGQNDHGIFGDDSEWIQQPVPRRLDDYWTFEDNKEIIDFYVGLTIFAFVDATGDGIYDEIWGWGSNVAGQLGVATLPEYNGVPLRLDTIWTFEDGKKIINFYSTAANTIWAFVDATGDGIYDEIWGWGDNTYGVLSNGSYLEIVYTPIRLDTLSTWTFANDKKITNFLTDFNAVYVFLDSNNDQRYDEIWGWGNTYEGTLGNNNVSGMPEIVPIQFDDIWASPDVSISNISINSLEGEVTYTFNSITSNSDFIIPGVNDVFSSHIYTYTIYNSSNIPVDNYIDIKFTPTIENSSNSFKIQNYDALLAGDYTLEIKIDGIIQASSPAFKIINLQIPDPSIAISNITSTSAILNYIPLKIGSTSYYSIDGGLTWIPFLVEEDGTTLITGLEKQTQYNLMVSDDQIFTQGIDYETSFTTTRVLPAISNLNIVIKPTSILAIYDFTLNEGWLTTDVISYSFDGGTTKTEITLEDFSDGSFIIENLIPNTFYEIDLFFNSDIVASKTFNTYSTIASDSDFTSTVINANYSNEKLTFKFYYEDPTYFYEPSLTLTNTTPPTKSIKSSSEEALILNINGVKTSITSGVPIILNQSNGLISGQMNEITISGFSIDSIYEISLVADNGRTPITINVNGENGSNGSFVATPKPSYSWIWWIIIGLLLLILILVSIWIYKVIKDKKYKKYVLDVLTNSSQGKTT